MTIAAAYLYRLSVPLGGGSARVSLRDMLRAELPPSGLACSTRARGTTGGTSKGSQTSAATVPPADSPVEPGSPLRQLSLTDAA